MPDPENDNHGRRQKLRSLFGNDPFYRRVKDAFLIILALAGASGMVGVDLTSILKTAKPDAREEKRERYGPFKEQLNSHDVSIKVLENSVIDIGRKLDRLDDKIDRLIIPRGPR